MDLATLFGVLLAWGAVLFSMWHVTEGAMGAYLKPPEMFLVFGGSLGAALLSMPLHNITGAFNYLKKWVLNKDAHIEHIIKEMVQYAETARRDGVPARSGPRWPWRSQALFTAACCRTSSPVRSPKSWHRDQRRRRSRRRSCCRAC
jgi:chemotaxis protein MotA